MKVITYFALTMLSLAIQYVVMDIIQEKVKIDAEEDKTDLNVSSPRKIKDFPLQFTYKPQALYYRTPKNGQAKRTTGNTSNIAYSNSSIDITFETSTELSSTLFDFLYDDNTSVTDGSLVSATEALDTTTEFENVTEISLFGTKNSTTVKPKTKTDNQTPMSKDCKCNLLYNVCDINCCCDVDCTDAERDMFVCTENIDSKQDDGFCYSPFSYSDNFLGPNVDHLICIVKTNIPEKRNIQNTKHNPAIIYKTHKWHISNNTNVIPSPAKPNLYKYGDPVWLLRNNTIYYADLPSTVVNNYCNDRQPVQFLKNQYIKCTVKLMDLEILRILNIVEETYVISMTDKSLNSSSMNCSTLHCTNWTMIVCEENTCTKYNKSLHNPLCTDSICTHLALRIDYIFHYYTNKIMNATIKLFTRKVSPNVQFIEQEINVQFVIGNESVANIVQLSGNPGYITGLPVIVSYLEGNRTENFYNSSKKYLSYPNNEEGECKKSTKDDYILFGVNMRLKCRYFHAQSSPYHNITDVCKYIQNNITDLIKSKGKITISPIGNPSGVKDEDWLPLQFENIEDPLYGQLNAGETQLVCYNLITRFSFIFTFMTIGDDKRVISARINVTPLNVSLNIEDMSTVVTVDTSFIDETPPAVYEYAGGPQLNFHLPSDFFFPFHSNKVSSHVFNVFLIIFVCIPIIILK